MQNRFRMRANGARRTGGCLARAAAWPAGPVQPSCVRRVYEEEVGTRAPCGLILGSEPRLFPPVGLAAQCSPWRAALRVVLCSGFVIAAPEVNSDVRLNAVY